MIIVCIKGGALNISAQKRTLGCSDFYSNGTSKGKVWMVVKGKHKPGFNCYLMVSYVTSKLAKVQIRVQIDSVSTTGIKLDLCWPDFQKKKHGNHVLK
jgi:hypothetical protein